MSNNINVFYVLILNIIQVFTSRLIKSKIVEYGKVDNFKGCVLGTSDCCI